MSDGAPAVDIDDWRAYDGAVCSVARTMAVLGEPWTVLVVRDVLNGVTRFDDLVDHLGVARTVLARRLARLVEVGVVETRAYREPGRRTRDEYRLTAAGRDLRPVLLALMAWGDAHRSGPEGPPVVVRHAEGCDAPVVLALECEAGHRLDGAPLRTTPGPGARRRG